MLVFAAPPGEVQGAGAYYLILDRYLGPVPCPMVVLTRPPEPAVRARLHAARHVWVLSGVDDLRPYLPDVRVVLCRAYPGIGTLWELAVP